MSQLPDTPSPGGGRPIEALNNNLSDGRDLPDSPHDLERMKPDASTIVLPDVKDIPGQEHIVPPILGEYSDDTISSDEEEGNDTLEDDEDDDIIMGTEADISAQDLSILERTDSDMPFDDDINLRRAALDSTDQDGEVLNEGSFADDISGGDLDISGTDGDDPMEAIGEEDEENNHYSMGSSENDKMNEGTP